MVLRISNSVECMCKVCVGFDVVAAGGIWKFWKDVLDIPESGKRPNQILFIH